MNIRDVSWCWFLLVVLVYSTEAGTPLCYPGWFATNDGACVVVGLASKWHEAWQFCHRHNGFIAGPGKQFYIDNNLLQNNLTEQGIDVIWSGLHVRNGKLQLDGFKPRKPQIFPRSWQWGEGEPEMDEEKLCGQISLTRQTFLKRSVRYAHEPKFGEMDSVKIQGLLTSSYLRGIHKKRSAYFSATQRRLRRAIETSWHDVINLESCEEKLPFICQASPVKTEVTHVSVCGEGSTGNYYVNRCFSIQTAATTFNDAKISCKKRNKELVRYSTQFEISLVNIALFPNWFSNNILVELPRKPVWVETSNRNCSIVVNSPDTQQPDSGQPDSGQPDSGQPDSGQPDTLTPWYMQDRSISSSCDASFPFMCEERALFSTVSLYLTHTLMNGRWDENRHLVNSELFLPYINNMPKILSQADNVTCHARHFINQLQRITWFKDGGVVPSSLVTNIQSGVTLHFTVGRGIEFFPGYYWCEVVDLKTTLIVRSPKIFVRHSEMEMFAGTVRKDEKYPPSSVALFNYLGRSIKMLPEILRPKREIFNPFVAKPLRLRMQGEVIDFLAYRRLFSSERVKPSRVDMSRSKEIEEARRHMVYGLNVSQPDSPDILLLDTLTLYDIDNCLSKVVTDTERDVIYQVPQTPLGKSFQSKDICLVNNKPFVEILCGGSKLYGAQWRETVFNRHCDFDDVDDTEVSASLRNLSKIEITESNVDDVVSDALKLTEDDAVLNEKDIIYSADIIQKASHLKHLSSEVAEEILDLAENVMKKSEEILIKSEKLGRAASRIIKSLDMVDKAVVIPPSGALRLMTGGYATTIWDLNKYATKPVIGLQMESDSKLTNESLVALFNTNELVFRTTEAAIVFPKSFVENVIKDHKSRDVRLTMHVFKDTRLFTATEHSTGISADYVLNSKVIAAKLSVDNKQITELNGVQVRTVFLPNKILNEDVRDNLTDCGFWDWEKDGGFGGWSVEGCHHSQVEHGRDVCLCDHLTNFAVLLDFYGQTELDKTHQLAMSIITIIGLSLSIAGLSLTVLTFLLFRKLRQTRPQQTLFNLALAQLCAWIVFLAGINQTQHHGGCIAVAVLLHYFIVASFMWMLVEAILHYLLFVKVLGSYVSNYITKTAIPAWGIPLVPIIVVLAIDYNMYRGGDTYCWMSLVPFYYAFALPVGLIILANLVLYCMVVVSICRKTNVTVKSTQTTMQRHLVSVRASVFCFILLGLSWMFGYLAISDARVVFQYLFTITNTIQGFLIFVLFTARDKQVRESWKSLCCPRKTPHTASSTGKHMDNIPTTRITGNSTSSTEKHAENIPITRNTGNSTSSTEKHAENIPATRNTGNSTSSTEKHAENIPTTRNTGNSTSSTEKHAENIPATRNTGNSTSSTEKHAENIPATRNTGNSTSSTEKHAENIPATRNTGNSTSSTEKHAENIPTTRNTGNSTSSTEKHAENIPTTRNTGNSTSSTEKHAENIPATRNTGISAINSNYDNFI